ncbi:MAG: divergent polysaccharide deacetylase family protein [Bilophila sp.]
MSEWFPAIKGMLAERGIYLPQPYPHTCRTLKGSALAAVLSGAVLGTGICIYSTFLFLAHSVQEVTSYASETITRTSLGVANNTAGLVSVLPTPPAPPAPPEPLTTSVLEEDSHLGQQVRLKIQPSALPYREYGVLSLTDAARQVDFALLQTLLRLHLERGRLLFLTSDYKTKGQDVYHLQRMRLFLPTSVESFVEALEESMDVWAERGVLTRETPNKITLAVEGVVTHELWVDTAGDEFVLPPTGDAPRLTLVIDDLGESPKAAQAFLDLHLPMTFAIWPFGRHAVETAQAAHRAGREILVHEPMEPMQSPFVKAGPGELTLSMNRETLRKTLQASVLKVPHASGLNNHMGSRLTRNPAAAALVAEALGPSGLFALDSLTHPDSVFYREARKKGLPAYRRSVFLDDGPRTVPSVLEALKKAEHLALAHGQAIAIGHPHPETIEALRQWGALRDTTIQLVPLRYLNVPVETVEE